MVVRIALVTPIYGTDLRYLGTCLDSALSWLKCEVSGVEFTWTIVIDGDRRPIEDYVARTCHITRTAGPSLVRLPTHVGLGAARNAACLSLDADYYGWLDADDALDTKEYLEFLSAALSGVGQKPMVRLFFSDSYDCDERLLARSRREKLALASMHSRGKGTNRDPLAFVDFVYQPQLVHALSFAAIGGFAEDILGEDVDLILRLAALDTHPNFAHIPVSPYLYRHNPRGISESRWDELRQSMEQVFARYGRVWAGREVTFRYAGEGVMTSRGTLALVAERATTNACHCDVYLPQTEDSSLLPDFMECGPK